MNPLSNSAERISHWRSLEQLVGTPAFNAAAQNEFPGGLGATRRDFLKVLGPSLALAGITGCTRQPIGRIVPYIRQPEEVTPGKPLFFATAMTLGGYAGGLLVESHEGHPTKIEGNPEHPINLGASSAIQQASLLDLYDPDRSQAVLSNGHISSWAAFLSALQMVLADAPRRHGSGLRILSETVTSPTLHAQLLAILERFPDARWHQYEPINQDNLHMGSLEAFGLRVEPQYHFEKARVVVALDSDFMFSHPAALLYMRKFMDGRRVSAGRGTMNRLYAIESTPTVTGSNADHRLGLDPSGLVKFAQALARRLGIVPANDAGASVPQHTEFIAAIADDLRQSRGDSVIIAGEGQPPFVHVLAHVMNDALGNVGKTVNYTASAQANPVHQLDSLRALVEDLNHGAVSALIILGGNPVYTTPVDLAFAQSLSHAAFSTHLSTEINETSVLCQWHIPQNHYLESWGDARAYDGTVSLVQPLIMPLYAGKSPHEILDALLPGSGRTDYDIVRDYWQQQNRWSDFEQGWRRALHDGVVADTTLPAVNPKLRAGLSFLHSVPAGPIEIVYRPDPTIWDGRFANNGWLQELAKPITKLTWDNAALISPQLAERLAVANGEMVEVNSGSRSLRLPAWVTPGQAENTITVHLGYGRSQVGRVGAVAGFNAYALRSSNAAWASLTATVRAAGGTRLLATTQNNHVIDSAERQVYREATLERFRSNPALIRQTSQSPQKSETLFNPGEHRYEGYRWAMSIDLTTCTGCNACVLACQSENNIPVVGRAEVARGRDMQWIRIDTYFSGRPEQPAMSHQPVPCMHCEMAPCELVCPVGATLHDHEGLNLQVYNRCVGTRYCSNNCPYKVRRFNFYQYADYRTPSLKPMRNPNVTVRWRGVMEKCTYCIQRISAARINSEASGRRIRDGEVVTACQQACPVQAIVFGDLNDPDSHVARLKQHPLDYSMLGELNTRPRTTYLAKLRNPNPALGTANAAAVHGHA